MIGDQTPSYSHLPILISWTKQQYLFNYIKHITKQEKDGSFDLLPLRCSFNISEGCFIKEYFKECIFFFFKENGTAKTKIYPSLVDKPNLFKTVYRTEQEIPQLIVD